MFVYTNVYRTHLYTHVKKHASVEAMGMEAAASYLRKIRESRKISRGRLAAQLDVSEMSIWRIEEEGQEPRAVLFMSLVRTLGASWDDLMALIADAKASREDGRNRAEQFLSAERKAEELRRIYPTSEQARQRATQLVQKLIH